MFNFLSSARYFFLLSIYLVIIVTKMDNTTHASNIKDDDEVNTNNAAKIPKVNMRFDGSSWKNQALSPNNISERSIELYNNSEV